MPARGLLCDGSELAVREMADFVIVGSGAAGATCARWLAAAGHEVVVVEEGAAAGPAPGGAAEALASLYRDGGAVAAIGPDPLPLLQGCCVGGTTVINGGIQVPLPEAVWREWVRRDSRWARLLPWEELERCREAMDRELSVAPTPPGLWGGNGRTMLAGLGEDARPTRRNAPGCRGTGRCLQGCPHDGRASADLTLLPRAIGDGARLYARCRVLRVFPSWGHRPAGVAGRFRSGAPFRAHARRAVILAASAIQTPWLIARSGLPGAMPAFQCHPGSALAGLFPEALDPTGATQAMESHAWLGDGLKFETLGMPAAFKRARVPGVGRKLQERLALLDRVALWGVCVRAEAVGAVRRGPWGPIVHYALTPRDRQVMLRGLSILAIAMLEAGASEVWPAVYGAPEIVTSRAQAAALADLPARPGMVPMVATHLFGGVHVTDRFQVAGLPGLVVADSSLFPTNLGVNPMSAITAVATLVAEAWS
ncbi:MAG: GMC family oxidoreductase [Candidatus Sericytochromatia bacterium]|nr:GMC family oxidoreductase [Candidatus Tanganyikabacteria bacterium]